MGKDFWGGMFDFNGDGRTTWDEEMLGLSFLEEERKRTAKNLDSIPVHKHKKPKERSVSKIKEVPEIVDESNYHSLRSEYRTECICALVALVLMLIPAVVVLWAVYSTYDPQNSASDFITIIFTIAGLIYGGVVIHTIFKSINTSIENLSLLKERYKGSNLSNRKFNLNWLWLLLIPASVVCCFLFSLESDVEYNNDYKLPSTSYTQAENKNNSSIISKRINTEPAMKKEDAERLRGTGYHGTCPNSSAEALELKAAQVKCKKCGMRSHNGYNSLCDACQYNERYGLD